MSAIDKYLARFAEPEARLPELAGLRAHGRWTHAITIPLRREHDGCLAALAGPAARARVLAVLVVNAADDALDQQDNAALLAAIESRARPLWRGPGLSLQRLAEPDPELDVLLVDRSTPPRAFSPRDGVGLARKLGADLITRLIADDLIERPWIHTTDADAELPAEHFERVVDLPAGAAVAPFRHVEAGDAAVHQATLRYELSLRYYVLGLHRAASPYAFHTIGSLISVAASHYAMARGFPRRTAGEDFYMLNKLAKLGPVHRLGGAPVRLASRRSVRTPFGTGPAVERQLAGEPFTVYDPRTFESLRETLCAVLQPTLPSSGLEAIPELEAWLGSARALADRYGLEQLPARVREHFDGFRTLKLIHALTVRWPKIAWHQAVERASFLRPCLQPCDELSLAEQRDRLAQREADVLHLGVHIK